MSTGTRPSNSEKGLKEFPKKNIFELPLAVVMRKYVSDPIDLDNTASLNSPVTYSHPNNGPSIPGVAGTGFESHFALREPPFVFAPARGNQGPLQTEYHGPIQVPNDTLPARGYAQDFPFNNIRNPGCRIEVITSIPLASSGNLGLSPYRFLVDTASDLSWLFSDLMHENDQPVGFAGPFRAIPPNIYRARHFGTSSGHLSRGKGTLSYFDGKHSIDYVLHSDGMRLKSSSGPELEVPFIFGALTNASWLKNVKKNRFHPRVQTFYDGLLALGPFGDGDKAVNTFIEELIGRQFIYFPAVTFRIDRDRFPVMDLIRGNRDSDEIGRMVVGAPPTKGAHRVPVISEGIWAVRLPMIKMGLNATTLRKDSYILIDTGTCTINLDDEVFVDHFHRTIGATRVVIGKDSVWLIERAIVTTGQHKTWPTLSLQLGDNGGFLEIAPDALIGPIHPWNDVDNYTHYTSNLLALPTSMKSDRNGGQMNILGVCGISCATVTFQYDTHMYDAGSPRPGRGPDVVYTDIDGVPVNTKGSHIYWTQK